MPNQKQNFCNRLNFEAAIALLKVIAPKNKYYIKQTALDYGAGMSWETIICVKPTNYPDYDSYQMLCPRDWDALQQATDPLEIAEIVNDLVKYQKRLLGL